MVELCIVVYRRSFLFERFTLFKAAYTSFIQSWQLLKKVIVLNTVQLIQCHNACTGENTWGLKKTKRYYLAYFDKIITVSSSQLFDIRKVKIEKYLIEKLFRMKEEVNTTKIAIFCVWSARRTSNGSLQIGVAMWWNKSLVMPLAWWFFKLIMSVSCWQ